MDSFDPYINQKTGEIYNPDEWIIHSHKGKITRVKRLSSNQLAFIKSLEYQLGYKPKNHANMPAYKASIFINKLLARLEEKNIDKH